MQIEFEVQTVLPALKAACAVLQHNAAVAHQRHVAIQASATELRFIGANSVLMVEAVTRAEVRTHGEATVPGKKLLGICAALPADTQARLVVDDKGANFTARRSRFKLSTLPFIDYACHLPPAGPVTELQVPAGALRTALERVRPAMAVNDARYYLNGLLLEVASEALRLVATDGHRLALCESAHAGGAELRVIVPRETVLALLAHLGESEATITLSVGARHLTVQLGDVRITSNTIEASWPDWRRVIPAANAFARVEVKALIEAVRRCQIIAADKHPGVDLALKDATLHVAASNENREEAADQLPAEHDRDAAVRLNPLYLLDACAAVRTEQLRLYVNKPDAPCLVTDDNDASEYRCVVMPMRV